MTCPEARKAKEKSCWVMNPEPGREPNRICPNRETPLTQIHSIIFPVVLFMLSFLPSFLRQGKRIFSWVRILPFQLENKEAAKGRCLNVAVCRCSVFSSFIATLFKQGRIHGHQLRTGGCDKKSCI